MSLRIAMVTWSGLPGLAADDRLAADALRARGAAVMAAAWDDASVDWAAFDAVVLRSCWDYHLRPAEFLRWIDRLEAAGARLWNPAPVVRWNAHKGYLLDLADAGWPIVPTALLRRGDRTDLADLLRERRWHDAVLKPAIGASAWGARRISADATDAQDLEPWRAGHDLLVQPFMTEIAASGEWSLMFIGGAFSHAVRKRPGGGDFRVQYELGGSLEPLAPPDPALALAGDILAAAPGAWIYARVDMVLTDRGFLLMELELLEPSLFLEHAEGAAQRLAGAIERVARE